MRPARRVDVDLDQTFTKLIDRSVDFAESDCVEDPYAEYP